MRLRLKHDPQGIHPLSRSNDKIPLPTFCLSLSTRPFLCHHLMDQDRGLVNLWLKDGLLCEAIGLTVTYPHLSSWSRSTNISCRHSLHCNSLSVVHLAMNILWMSSGFPCNDNKQTQGHPVHHPPSNGGQWEICIRAGEWPVPGAQMSFWASSACGSIIM